MRNCRISGYGYYLPKNTVKFGDQIRYRSNNQETELFNRKNLLEEYQVALKAFLDFKKENSEALNKTREPKKERKELIEQRKKINDEIKQLKDQKSMVKPEIENMKKIVEKLKEDKRQISQQISCAGHDLML